MSVEDIDNDYPIMTHATYSKDQYQIDSGASLTAISESKGRQLQCKFIQRKKLQIVVSVANGEMMRSQFYTPLKVTITGIGNSGQRLMKTVRIIANIVPSLSGDIIIGSDVMKTLRIKIPCNDENTATLRVAGEKLIFKYNTTMRPSTTAIKKMIIVKKSTRAPISAEESFNSLFYGDRYNDIQLPSHRKKKGIRSVPSLLKERVLREYDLAASDPKAYLQNLKHSEVSIAHLVALHIVFNDYDVEVAEDRSIVQKDGTVVHAEVKVLQHDMGYQFKKKSTTLDAELSLLMSSPTTEDVNRDHKMQDDIVLADDDIVHNHKLAVINGEEVEDVAQVSSNVDPHQQQQELDKTLKYIEAIREKH